MHSHYLSSADQKADWVSLSESQGIYGMVPSGDPGEGCILPCANFWTHLHPLAHGPIRHLVRTEV
jgi:hypothetical protein